MKDNSRKGTFDDTLEQKSIAEQALIKAKAKDEGKVAVRVCDKVNTILIVPPERKKTAVKEFLERTKVKVR